MSKKTVPAEKYDELKEFFVLEIARRDKEIERLKTENKHILKTALKQSEKNEKWSELVDKLKDKLNSQDKSEKHASKKA